MTAGRKPSSTLALAGAIVLAMAAAGCETLQFYRQAAWGQWQIMHARQDVDALLAQPQTEATLARQLALSREILAFGAQHMQMPSDGRYAAFVDLQREYVLWNVFAARPYSLDGDQWCYPIVGCAPYRGYFDEARAERVAQRYAEQGFETYVGGVPAYSTLGWFDDPLLSSFLYWPTADLANLLLHELAHSRVWVNGDVAFNESFAEFVGQQGSRAWFEQHGSAEQWALWHGQRQHWRAFRAFIVAAKQHLQSVYAGEQEFLAERKRRSIDGLQACYRAKRDHLGAGRYDELMAQHFNNAFLLSVGTYADWLPAFGRLFDQAQGDWNEFFATVETIAAMDHAARQAQLAALAQQHIGQSADDQRAHQVNCEAFLGHGAHTEAAG